MSSENGKSPIEKYREYVLNLPQDKIEIEVEDKLDFYIIRGVYNFNKKEASDLGILLVLKIYHNNLKKWRLDSDIFEQIHDKSSMFIVMQIIIDLNIQPNYYSEFFQASHIYEIVSKRKDNSKLISAELKDINKTLLMIDKERGIKSN